MADIVNPLQSTSYTNKDFTSIYTELLDLTKELASTWDPTISNESDPGVILLKLNAIIGDKLSYNSDTNVLELFPLSVTQEKNARQLFEQLGYYMHWYKAATTDVSIAWMGTKDYDKEYTIPAFTMVSDFTNTVTYTLIGPADGTTINTFKVGSQKLKLDGSSISFKAIQGIPVQYSVNGETLINVNHLDYNNRLYFPTLDIAENGIFITNYGANNYTDWKKVNNLLVQSVSVDNLFYKFGVSQDTSTCYIEFPENAEEIFKNGINITYIKTLGEEGNVSYKTIEKFYSEFSPIEDDSIVFNTDNIRMLNYASAINGENTQTINNAYKKYKSTVGVFETLITLRDYIGYILNSDLVSNCFVCDRTNDVQCTYKIMTQSNDIDQVVTVVEEENGQPLMSAFDLKLYLLQLPTSEMTTQVVYSSTFDMLNEAHQENVKSYIDDIKCISHDYAEILPTTTSRSHFCYFKNKYPITCRIVTQYQLTNIAANEVVNNIRENLYKALNSKEVIFGEEVPQELIYNIIMSADERIKNVMLDNIEYSTYAVCYNDTLESFFEIEISSEDTEPISIITNKNARFTVTVNEENFTRKIGIGDYSYYQFIYDSANTTWKLNDEAVNLAHYGISVSGTLSNGDFIIAGVSLKTQLREEVFTKSVLAGVTQFLVEDETFDYKLNQMYDEETSNLLDRINSVETNTEIQFSNTADTYTLKSNETIQLFSPNLVDSTVYSTYVKFEYCLNNNLNAEEDYQLGVNEYFIMYWKESQTDSLYKYAVYGEGNIIKLKSFSLTADDGSSNIGSVLKSYVENIGTSVDPVYYTDSVMDNRMTYDISQNVASITSSSNTLSTTKTITIRKINQVTLESGDSYCYWILNQKSEDSNSNETYRLFEEGESTKLLNSGEYFIYTNSSLSNLTILGAGTLISRSDSSYVWEVSVKDASSILENGISAFTESDWFKITPSDSYLVLTEQHYLNVPSGSDFRLRLARNRKDYCDLSISASTGLVATVDADTWFDNTTGYGTYTFTYDNGWKYQSTSVALIDYGITLAGDPVSGSTITVEVSGWEIVLSKDGARKHLNIESSEQEHLPEWISISLKDFDISYKSSSSDATYTSIAALNLASSDYSWNARTLLALNSSDIREQVLLSGQSITVSLYHKWYYAGDAITLTSNTTVYFNVNDINYSFNYNTTITDIIFDFEENTLLVNGNPVLYTENSAGNLLIELTNKYTIEGADITEDSGKLYYPSAIMTSFDLVFDGGQSYTTYRINDNLEIEFLKLYVYKKMISTTTQVHMNDDGEIDLEFTKNITGGTTININFNLPVGEYILPVTIGTEELERFIDSEEGLVIFLNTQQLHAMNNESAAVFNKKQKYFIYFVVQEANNYNLMLTVPSTIAKNVPVILGNIYKFNYVDTLTEFQAYKILKLMGIWDKDNLYNYTYVVDKDEEISNPLEGKSFFLSNHIYNPYTIPQMMNNAEINILGKSNGSN